MFIAGNFLSALAEVLNWVLKAYMWIIIARALISWGPIVVLVSLRASASEQIWKFLCKTCDAARSLPGGR